MTGLDTYVSATWNDAFGRIGQFDLGADHGVHETASYDDATGRLIGSLVGTGGSSGVWSTWTDLLNTAYTWDPAGNLTNKTFTEADSTINRECFTYDGLRQLTQAWTTAAGACQATPTQAVVGGPDPYWQSYTYDTATGNRKNLVNHAATGDTTSTYTYPAANAQPHTLSSVTLSGASTGTSGYGYDADGNTDSRNLVGKPGQTLTWDAEGHLATLTANGNTTSYVYDAAGNRLIAKDNTGETVYLGPTEIHRTTAGTVTCTRYYSYNGGVIAVRTDPGTLNWQAVDNHGTAELTVNATTKTIASRLRTDPFGNPRNANAWPGTKGFVNGTTDPTGLTHLGAREYDPTIGRFISADPVFEAGDPQQMGGYAYAGSNPSTVSDPGGTCVKLEDMSGPCAGQSIADGSAGANKLAAVEQNQRRQEAAWRDYRRRLARFNRRTNEDRIESAALAQNKMARLIEPAAVPDKKQPCEWWCTETNWGGGKFINEHVFISGGFCIAICVGATYQHQRLQISWGGFGGKTLLQEGSEFRRLGGGWNATIGLDTATPEEQGMWTAQACGGDGLGGCVHLNTRADTNSGFGGSGVSVGLAQGFYAGFNQTLVTVKLCGSWWMCT
jgi:RHS repeat-associated protein